MLVSLAEELDISVSTLLGEVVQEESLNEGNLKSISEKLEIINLQLIKRSEMRMRTIRYFFISVCTITVSYTHLKDQCRRKQRLPLRADGMCNI